MKTTLIAASALLGSATAGVHHMKLEKIPLEQQFASASVQDHIRALHQKYSQKFLSSQTEDIFQHTSIDIDGRHDVPVENFLNAQCKQQLRSKTVARILTYL